MSLDEEDCQGVAGPETFFAACVSRMGEAATEMFTLGSRGLQALRSHRAVATLRLGRRLWTKGQRL